MKAALILSLFLHFFLVGGMVWSSQLSMLLYLEREDDLSKVGELEVSQVYKPTNTKMRKGDSRKDLPPPKIPKQKNPADQMQMVKKQPPKPKSKPKPKPKPQPKKQEEETFDPKAIAEQLRAEAETEELAKMPDLDNFPKIEDGDEDSLGTGGSAQIEATPAQRALQAAMRRHFELPNAVVFRKQNPDARGILDLKLIGVGQKLEIVSLSTRVSSGFSILDQSCRQAIRKAISTESFSRDIISELSGKENQVLCTP